MISIEEREDKLASMMRGGLPYADHNPFWKAYLRKLLKIGQSNPEKLAKLINTQHGLVKYLIREGHNNNYDWTFFLDSSWRLLENFSQNSFNQMGLLVQCSNDWKLKIMFSGLGKQKKYDPIISSNFVRFDEETRKSNDYNEYWTRILLIEDYEHKAFIEGYLEDNPALIFPTSNTYFKRLLKTLGEAHTYRNNSHLQGWLTNFIAGLELPEGKAKYKKRFDLLAATSPYVDKDIKEVYKARIIKNRLSVSEFNMFYFPEENYPELLKFMTPKETDELITSLITKRRNIPEGLRKHFIKNLNKYNIDDLVSADWLPDILNAYLAYERYSTYFTSPETKALFSQVKKEIVEYYGLPIDYITQDVLLSLMKTAGTEKLIAL